jgi:hypothetical protein
VTFRSNTGMVFAWRMKSYKGPWCRECGEAIFRKAMDHTLMAGWFGLISFFANLFFVAQNVAGRAKVMRLKPPVESSRPSLPAGVPLYRRAGIYVAALVLVVVSVYGVWRTHPAKVATRDLAGRCVNFETNTDGHRVISRHIPKCSGDHDGKVLQVVTVPNECPAATSTYFVSQQSRSVICVEETG